MTQDAQIDVLRAELTEAKRRLVELQDVLANMLRRIPAVEIERHGFYRHAAQLVADRLL